MFVVMVMAMGGATVSGQAWDGIGIAGRSGQWLLGSDLRCSDEWGTEMGPKTDVDVMPSFNLSTPPNLEMTVDERHDNSLNPSHPTRET